MSKPRLEWRVGLFVLIGLALVTALLLEFSKGMTLFRPTYDIHLHASNAGSLQPRAAVRMSGVPVGSVSDIELSADGKYVIITLKVFSRYRIYKTARFVVEQSGFLGDQYVAIIPTQNEGEFFQNGDQAQAEAPFNMQEFTRTATGFLGRINETAQRLNETLVDVRRDLLNPQTLTNLSLTAANMRAASDRAVATINGIDALVATNSPGLTAAGSNFLVLSRQLNQFAGSLTGLLATNTPAIERAVKNIESSTEMMNSVLNDVQAGKGLAGTLVRNEDIGRNLEQIAQNLSITSSNLNRLGLWGILWKHKPPEPPPSAARPLAAPKDLYE